MTFRTLIALSASAILLAGCMGNTASSGATGNAIVQAAAAQAMAQGAASSSASLLPVGRANGTIASAADMAPINTALVGNAFTGTYQSYSCDQLTTLIGTLQPSQAASGLSAVAGIASVFGRGRAAQAAGLINGQAQVSQTQAAQLQAAQAVAASKGC